MTCSARCAQVRQRRMGQQRHRSKRHGKVDNSREAKPVKSARMAKMKPSTMKRKTRPLLRQWQFVQRLSAAKSGVTVRQLAHDAGIGLKTVRRDQVGFRVVEKVGERGRKDWRIVPVRVRIPPAPLAARSSAVDGRFARSMAPWAHWRGATVARSTKVSPCSRRSFPAAKLA